ncbi:probable aspartic proteinase GIP2 [Lactuca sativa]|uniref:probable aspartic proteinase GIP2 n=1 Tax=Lactuca sativa TaxID=4236 RepID=UPI000CD89067|nr:probable aspartic proteinase GIP2 [Lactuca sativa]
MAFSQTLTTLFIFSLLSFCYAASGPPKLPKPKVIHFSIRKNETTLQYYVSYDSGYPQSATIIDALIDIGAPSVWFDCTSYVSSSYKRASCGSNRCKKAKGRSCIGCNSAPRPGCSNNTCGVFVYNPARDYSSIQELGEDTMRAYAIEGAYVWFDYEVPKFQFACADSAMAERLPGDYTKGLVGFARNEISLPSQISSAFKLAKKFALCLPSSNARGLGDIFIGGGPYYMLPSIEDQSLSLVTTPLVFNPIGTPRLQSDGELSYQYFINLKNIEISGKHVTFSPALLSFDKNGVGGTKISTTVPYTILHSSIYKSLVKDFIKEASLNKIKRLNSVAPFGACFDLHTVPNTITGPAVPNIDLILEGNVRMRLYGANSMVEAKKNVICLAFIDGGGQPTTSIVLGGHQLENYILEFDLTASKLGLSSSLLLQNTSCSQSRVY